MNKPTLLERAKAVNVELKQKPVDLQLVELAVAYMNGEITARQAAGAFGLDPRYNSYHTTIQSKLASVLRRAAKQGVARTSIKANHHD